MTVPWNLTRSARGPRAADVLVISVGKSGRTWLRVLVNKYISLHFGVPFGLEDLHRHDVAVPSICYTHELWEHVSKTSPTQRVLGKYLVPARILARKKVVLLYRDPRDVVVSLYFQKSRRAVRRVRIGLGPFIRDPKFGIESIVAVMNRWRERLAHHRDCLWISYEALKEDPEARLSSLLSFVGVEPVRPEFVREAVAFAAFENMKKMEASGAFDSTILAPGDPSDPQSFKVREGKVGGYRKHFGDADLACLDCAVAALDPFYAYGTGCEP